MFIYFILLYISQKKIFYLNIFIYFYIVKSLFLLSEIWIIKIHKKKMGKWKIFIFLFESYMPARQHQSSRVSVLQSLAPTLIKHQALQDRSCLSLLYAIVFHL